jgi:S-methylmethionine-dependent homocysteine/selenocysteine methylase
MANLLIPTVTNLNATGMNLRKVQQWAAVSFTEHTEETDEASTAFTKAALATLTPANYHCRVDLTDERIASDWDNVRAAAALELGGAAAKHVDNAIADLFGTAVGWAGTIGPANPGTADAGTITWRAITKAYALLMNQNIPAGAPVYCALHPLTVAA